MYQSLEVAGGVLVFEDAIVVLVLALVFAVACLLPRFARRAKRRAADRAACDYLTDE